MASTVNVTRPAQGRRGAFIAFEGIDGSGKTTQIALAEDALARSGQAVLRTREPTSGPWGRRIRAMASSSEPVDPVTELEWFIQDRSDHVRNEIEPALASARTVLCDRYLLSTVAYQGAREGASPHRWRDLLDDQLTRFPAPTLALVFLLDPDTSLARVEARGARPEPAFEERSFLLRVDAIYRELCACGLPWVEPVDAAASVGAIAARVDELVERGVATAAGGEG